MSIVDKETAGIVGNMLGGKKYGSRGVAGTALGLGIAGTALALFGRDGRGLDLFGGGHHAEHERDAILAKENADVLMLTNQIWSNALRGQEQRFVDVVGINQKIFDSYVFTNAEIAGVKADANDKFFANYKETRDTKDKLVSEISELKTEVAVLKAIAPYQQQVTAAAIAASAQQSEIALMARTQKMLEGVLVPPYAVAYPDLTKSASTTSTSTANAGN